MSKFFCIALRVIPIAILGLGNSVNSALATVDTVENATDGVAPATDLTTNTLKQIDRYTQDIEETNYPSEITLVSPLEDARAKEVTKNSTQVTSVAATTDSPATEEIEKERISQASRDRQLIKPVELASYRQNSLSFNARDLAIPASVQVQNTANWLELNAQASTTPKLAQATEASKTDKSQYNLLNTTPRNLCREFRTNCPDKTETSLAMEADLFVREYLTVFVPELIVGLPNNVELEITPEVYNLVRTTDNVSSTEQRSGYGELIVSMNINFWENNGGQTALSMQPFIKLSTHQNNLSRFNTIGGGVIFPLEIKLSKKWDVSMEFEFDWNKNESAPGYKVGFANSVSLGYQISNKWNTYVELLTEMTIERDSQVVATVDTGLNYLLTEKLELDAGVSIGLTQAAGDIEPYVTLSVSF